MIKFFSALVVTFVTLCVLWCSAAPAATFEETGCARRAMVQGRVGEAVTTCELTRVPTTVVRTTGRHTARTMARTMARTGTTTVRHYGHRAPVYTITYLVSR